MHNILYPYFISCTKLKVIITFTSILFMKVPVIISYEGNIGAGKSTFVELLKTVLEEKNIKFIQEPVDEWDQIKDSNGKTMIEKYYGNQKKYAFSFQMMAYIDNSYSIFIRSPNKFPTCMSIYNKRHEIPFPF